MSKLIENQQDELKTSNQDFLWLGEFKSDSNNKLLGLLDNWETEKKKKFIFKLKILLKYDICKKNITNSLQAFIDKYIIGEIISRKVEEDLSKERYKIDSLRKNQLIHANSFNLHKTNYEISKYIENQISIKDIELLQSNIIIQINKLALFLKRYSAYLWQDIFSDKKQLILDKNTFTLKWMDLLFDAYFTVYSYKKLDNELLEHIRSIMEIIYVMQKVLIYINFSSLLNEICFPGPIKKEQEQKLLGLFALLRFLINKEKELSSTSIDKKFLLSITWLDSINNDLVKDFWNSIFIDDLKSVDEKNRNKILSALLVGPKFLLKLKKLDNPLYNYLKLCHETQLDKVIEFFKTNKIEYTQEQFLFIFENNLCESKIATKKDWLERAKTLFDNWILIEDIKRLNCEQFETLSFEKEINNTKNLVNLFLDDSEKHNEYQLFLEEKESLSEKLKFIHQSASWYEELLNLANLDFTHFNNSKDYIQKINQLFLDNDLHNVYERNKKLLVWEKYNIEQLDELYLLFQWLENRTLWKLLFMFFELSLEEVTYLKRFFYKFKWEKKDYDYILINKFIEKIFKTKELIDMYMEEDKLYSLSYIIWEIKNEINTQNTKALLDSKNSYTQLDLSEDDIYLRDRFKSSEEFEVIKKILQWINWYKKDFVAWIKTKKAINYIQLKNIYDLMNFFITRWIKSFSNIKLYFKLCYDLWEDISCIEFINNTFLNTSKFEKTEEIKNHILEYLKTRDSKILLDYSDKIIKLSNINANNSLDEVLLSTYEEWNIEKMNDLWHELSQIIDNIYDKLNPKILSSTINKASWTWTWSSTNAFRKIFIAELLLKQWESYSDYFKRISIINLRDVADLSLPDELNRKMFETFYNSSLDQSYMFFESLSELSQVIQRYQDENDRIEISRLLNKFKDLVDEWVKKFIKKYKNID